MNTSNTPQDMSSTTRREFLRTGSAAVAVGTLASRLNIARAAHVAGDDTIRIALIGCGGRGTQAASQALNTPGNVKLVAVADAFEDRLQACLGQLTKSPADSNDDKAHQGLGEKVDVSKERQFVGFDAYQQAIDSGVDMVILTTPPGFRPLHFDAAVRAGKHVFMEKPVAVDAPGVRSVLAAAEEAKKKSLCVGVGFQFRHDSLYRDTIKRLHEGAIGDILQTQAYFNAAGVWVRDRASLEKAAGRELSEMEYQMRNWYYFNWLCGDHIVEQAIHYHDVSNWLKGDYPDKAQGMGGRQVRKGKDTGQIFDHHMVEFTYPDGTQMISQCRHIPNCWNHVGIQAIGSNGTADIGKGRILGEEKWRYRGPTPNPYQVEHDELFAAIRSGTPYNNAENGAKSTMTVILGRMATYSGKVVKLEEALASSQAFADPGSYHSFEDQAPVLPDSEGNYPIAVPGVTQVL
ncbi:Gfo/Idh/MocA family protein [Bythopirellula polymerisocia]|uniref:Inositol 2-dehydrogenase n=1 Tax=Bythopirellula polymerisocia TaxID=2528003 RepID=A0A5C6CBD7_9BACT|nr:Gfo/Idh/MocA family oxidoreductase [Bythopirellula polymerisocia]TWU21402.1 Inositol 2-dehydrogenase [Bythopirellula polymerisocia]